MPSSVTCFLPVGRRCRTRSARLRPTPHSSASTGPQRSPSLAGHRRLASPDGNGGMVVAKSNRRKRQDRIKAGAKRAEQTRHRAKAGRERQTAERYRQLLDPRTSPVDVAGILAAELPDSLVAGAMMQIRLGSGVPGEEIAETARLMLASATEPPQIGTLAVAAGVGVSLAVSVRCRAGLPFPAALRGERRRGQHGGGAPAGEPAAPARIPGGAGRRARRTTDRHRMAAHRTRPLQPAQRTPAIVADRVSWPASLQLSQLIPLAARQVRAQRADAHSLTIHGFARPVPVTSICAPRHAATILCGSRSGTAQAAGCGILVR